MRRATRMTVSLAFGLALVAGSAPAAPASSTGRCGGTGGPSSKTLRCPPGQYVVGLRARGGMYVDQVGITCAAFDASGTRGKRGAWITGGPGGGSYAHDDVCEGNTALRYIYTTSGTYLDRVKHGGCQPRKASGGFEGRDTDSIFVDIGGLLGSACFLTCPSGEVLHSLTLKYGSWVDSLSGECRP